MKSNIFIDEMNAIHYKATGNVGLVRVWGLGRIMGAEFSKPIMKVDAFFRQINDLGVRLTII